MQPSQDSDDKNSTPDDESNCGCSNGESVCTAGTDEPQRNGVFKSSTLLAHRDCVTGLAIGGINTTWPVYCVHNTLFHYWRHHAKHFDLGTDAI